MGKVDDRLITAIYRNEEQEVLAAIEKGADVNLADKDGRPPLMIALLADSHNPRIVQHLLDSGADALYAEPRQHWTALHFAAREGKAQAVEMLLARGAVVDARDVFGNTPLWRAVMGFRGGSGEVIRTLLEHGADKTAANKSGISPLDLAKNTADNSILMGLLIASK